MVFPVVFETVIAALRETELLGGVYHGGTAIVVVVGGTAIVGDIESFGATIVGSRAPYPLVGLRAVDEIPAAGVAFKVVVPRISNGNGSLRLCVGRPRHQHSHEQQE